jgi:hypothetical protein
VVGKSRSGLGNALFALGAGIAGSFVSTEVAKALKPIEDAKSAD